MIIIIIIIVMTTSSPDIIIYMLRAISYKLRLLSRFLLLLPTARRTT